MKKEILIIAIVILIIFLIGAIILINKKQGYTKSDFALDSENKYIVTTDTKYKTVRDDGGSHTNIYYQIDLDNNSVIKCEDVYVGFKGYEHEGKIIATKELSNDEENELVSLFDKIIINKEGTTKEKPEDNGISSMEAMAEYYLRPFYIVSSYGNEDITVYSEEFISDFNKLLEKAE